METEVSVPVPHANVSAAVDPMVSKILTVHVLAQLHGQMMLLVDVPNVTPTLQPS